MKRNFLSACTLVIFFILGGCSFLAPRTSELNKIHNLYREEFLASVIPVSPNEWKDAACQPNEGTFIRTLQAIRDFQVQYREDDPAVTQHLYVLQAMIYIQSGRSGMARLMQKEFIDKLEVPKGRGDSYPRDALFAANLEPLIEGWMAYCTLDKEQGPFQNEKYRIQEKELKKAARAIEKNLKVVEVSDPAADEGALYLAASAALFEMWALKVEEDRCLFGKDCPRIDLTDERLMQACGNNVECRREKRREAFDKVKREDLELYRNLMGKYLSDFEKRAAETDPSAQGLSGRFRYLAIYQSLSGQ